MDRDYLGGSLVTGIGMVEVYLQTLPEKSISYWLNGAIAGTALFSGFLKGQEPYPPKSIEVSPQIFLRGDINLDFDEAQKIYFDLMDRGYIEATPYQAKLTAKFSPSEKNVFSESLDKFSYYI